MTAVLIFVATRSLVSGLFGALTAFLGQKIIDVQTGFWLVFGVIYLITGLAFCFVELASSNRKSILPLQHGKTPEIRLIWASRLDLIYPPAQHQSCLDCSGWLQPLEPS